MKSILLAGAAAFGVCMFGAVANATTVLDFSNLGASGYQQDTPVSPTLFQSQGLLLSDGVVTACGGVCLSSPANAYNGSITGTFVLPGTSTATTVTDLEFVGVTGYQTIALYDAAGHFIQDAALTGTAPNGFPDYTYTGATRVASFTTDLNYDGLLELGFNAGAVPEPATWAMLLLGLFGLGAMLRGRKTAGPAPVAA